MIERNENLKKIYYWSLFLTQTVNFIMNVYFTPVTMVNQGDKIDWG